MLRTTIGLLLVALASITLTPVLSQAVTVSVVPADTTVSVNDEFVVRISTDAVSDLKGFQLIFSYDPTKVVLLSAQPGDVLTSPGGAYAAFLVPDVSAPADTFWYDAAMLEGTSQGPGILVFARFKALASGDATLACGAVEFRDSNNNSTFPACASGTAHILSSPTTPKLVVSQIYGGGGNSGATYTHDFIEIFNSGGSPVNVTGWSVQYASASGSTWQTTSLSGTIPAGGYYLVQEAQGAGGTTSLPAPDATGTIAMSATSGKVALVNNGTALTGTCPSDASIQDLVGYGTANCSETAPTAALSNTTAARRNFAGCEDTDDNAANFTIANPSPRNSANPLNPCQFTLNVSSSPAAGGSVAKSPDQPAYLFGSTVQLTATPAAGYFFLNWSGDASGGQNPINVLMDSDKTIVANFTTNIAPHPVVISQVYGGGGNSGADYKNDFIELFNRGNMPVDLNGWSVQYASASGNSWFSTTLVGTIQPGRYFLIQQAQGAGGTLDLPTPDAFGGISMSANSGKVALVNTSAILTGNCPTGAMIEDFLGYGPADCAEGTPTAGLNNISATRRNSGGCVDTDDNLADFTTLAPTPRNSSSPFNMCSYWVGIVPERDAEFALGLTPNPTHGAMRVHFVLPSAVHAQLRVFDLQGRVLATLADGMLEAGRHEAHWSGIANSTPVRSGVYFVRLDVPGHTFTRTAVIAR